MKKILILALCFCLFSITTASALSLDDPSFNNPNEREDNASYVNTVSFGGWGGGVSRPSSHARSDTDSLLPYGAVELTLSSEASPTLIMGGVELPIRLENEDLFSARLGFWNGASFNDGENFKETNALCLTSEKDEAMWLIPGSVLRTLQSSGISHLILRSNETEATVSTAPFLSGAQYDLWRRAGYTDGTFLYLLALPKGSLEVQVGADTYTISESDPALNCSGIKISPLRGEP